MGATQESHCFGVDGKTGNSKNWKNTKGEPLPTFPIFVRNGHPSSLKHPFLGRFRAPRLRRPSLNIPFSGSATLAIGQHFDLV